MTSEPPAVAQDRAQVRRGHDPFAIVFLPDGCRYATLGRDPGAGATVEWWDAERGLQLRCAELDVDGAYSGSIDVDAAGHRVVVGCGAVFVLDAATGMIAARWAHHPEPGEPVLAGLVLDAPEVTAAVSRDGRVVASAGRRWLRVRDVETGTERRCIEVFEADRQADRIRAVSLSPDGARIAAVTEAAGREARTEAQVWDVATGTRLRRIALPRSGRLGVDASGALVSASVRDGALRLWDLDAEVARVIATGHHRSEALAFDATGRWLIALGGPYHAGRGATIYDLAGTEPPRRFAVPLDSRTTPSAAITGAGRRVAWGGSGHTVVTFDGDVVAGAPSLPLATPVVAPSPDGRWLVLGDHLLELAAPELGRRAPVTGPVAYSMDGRWLAGFIDDRLAIVDLADPRQPLTRSPPWRTFARELVVAPDGRRVFAIDHELVTWDVVGGTLEPLADAPLAATGGSLALSPDGRHLLVTTGSGCYVVATDAARIAHVLQVNDAEPGHTCVATWCGADHVIMVVDAVAIDRWTVARWSLAEPGSYRYTTINPNDMVASVHVVGPYVVAAGSYRGAVVVDREQLVEQRVLPGVVIAVDAATCAVISRMPDRSVRHQALATGAARPAPPELGSLVVLSDSRWLLDVRGLEVRLRDATTLEPVALLVVLPGLDAVVTAPSGLFDGTPAGWAMVAWRFGDSLGDVAPIDAFFGDYFAPGVLARCWRGDRPAPSQALATRDRRTARLALEVIEAAEPGPRIEVVVRAADPDGPSVRDVRLFRNRMLVAAWRGAHPAAFEGRTTIAVPLLGGELTAYGFNADNVKTPDARALVQPRVVDDAAEAVVLAIGINRYRAPGRDLRHAAADADAFARGLAHTMPAAARVGIGNTYARVRPRTLIDTEATKRDILAAIEAVVTASRPDTVVFVLFAGHGLRDGERFYLVPHDFDPDDVAGTAISDLELGAAFERLDAHRIVFVIDACFAGATLDASDPRQGLLNASGLAQLAFEKGMIVLAAAQSDQAALEDAALGHGLLTHALVVEGLEQARADTGDGVVELIEWLRYAANRVPMLRAEGAARDVEQPTGPPTPLQRPRLYLPPGVDRVTLLDSPISVAASSGREPAAAQWGRMAGTCCTPSLASWPGR